MVARNEAKDEAQQPQPDGPEESGQQEEDKPKRVELGEVINVLAKHSPVPSDPDDADLLGRFNAQVAEEKAQPQETQTGQPEDEEKAEGKQDEGPQQGSPQKGSPTAKPGSSTGARKEKT